METIACVLFSFSVLVWSYHLNCRDVCGLFFLMVFLFAKPGQEPSSRGHTNASHGLALPCFILAYHWRRTAKYIHDHTPVIFPRPPSPYVLRSTCAARQALDR
ncbi:hypothetical protein GGS23DRAFT_289819 [Durotheca rogersii]|uniref:uncharacterized protein n=1 Tax=Durotheca rogersii TaxID=419775 RepID=UPI00221EC74F|nr:uncharacterized protein GGS23DRAFT_289819 [Durotheca rogersii]KAI5866800.1 hypothetical protein GGS23DRAFT_289819 [Durotheca rogersii]